MLSRMQPHLMGFLSSRTCHYCDERGEAKPLCLSPDSRRKPSPTTQSHLCMAARHHTHMHWIRVPEPRPHASPSAGTLPPSPSLTFPSALLRAPVLSWLFRPSTSQDGSSPCSSSRKVTARLEKVAEAVKPPHTGLRKHSVRIKEWCSEGAEAVSWHCHRHSHPKPQGQGAPGGRDRARLFSPVPLLPSHLPGDQAPDQGQPPNSQSPQVLSGFWSPTCHYGGVLTESFLYPPDCSETTWV